MKQIKITDEQKIPLIALSEKIDAKELSVNQAYKRATEEYGFKGNVGDFIEMLKQEGLIDRDKQVNQRMKRKSGKEVAVIGLKVAAISLATYALYTVIVHSKKAA